MEGMRAFLLALLAAFAAFPLPSLSQGDAAAQRIARVEALLKDRPEDATLHFFLARFQCEAGNVAAAVAALQNVEKFGDGFLPTEEGFENCSNGLKLGAVRSGMEAVLRGPRSRP